MALRQGRDCSLQDRVPDPTGMWVTSNKFILSAVLASNVSEGPLPHSYNSSHATRLLSFLLISDFESHHWPGLLDAASTGPGKTLALPASLLRGKYTRGKRHSNALLMY